MIDAPGPGNSRLEDLNAASGEAERERFVPPGPRAPPSALPLNPQLIQSVRRVPTLTAVPAVPEVASEEVGGEEVVGDEEESAGAPPSPPEPSVQLYEFEIGQGQNGEQVNNIGGGFCDFSSNTVSTTFTMKKRQIIQQQKCQIKGNQSVIFSHSNLLEYVTGFKNWSFPLQSIKT